MIPIRNVSTIGMDPTNVRTTGARAVAMPRHFHRTLTCVVVIHRTLTRVVVIHRTLNRVIVIHHVFLQYLRQNSCSVSTGALASTVSMTILVHIRLFSWMHELMFSSFHRTLAS